MREYLFALTSPVYHIKRKVLKTTMSTVDAAICVSHTCRDNFILRAHMLPSIVQVIPNAVDPSKFIPDPSKRDSKRYVG